MSSVLSPVDYEAWRNGYMPPSEHILIDQLAYRGAKVIMSMDYGDKGAAWLVMRDGARPDSMTSLQLYKMLCNLIEPELGQRLIAADENQADDRALQEKAR